MKKHLLAVLLLAAPTHALFAEAPVHQPMLEFTSGLPVLPAETTAFVYDGGTCIQELTDASGAVAERVSYDDACKPAFLTASGQPSAASIVPIRWMAPESIWEPACALYLCPDGTFSPDFASAAINCRP